MAYNPYAVVQSLEDLHESGQQAKQQGVETREKTGIKKQEMKEEFLAEIKKAQEVAQIALQQQMKKKKGKGFLKILASAINPVFGAIYSGVDAARQGKKAGEHAVDMATLAKQYATSLPSANRWGKTFLSGATDEYLTGAEKGYGDILTQAEDMESKLSDPMEMFKTALATGVTQYGTGKAIGKGIDKFKSMKAIPKSSITSPTVGVDGITALGPEGIPIGMSPAAVPEASFLEKLKESLKTTGKGVEQVQVGANEQDILQGIIAMLMAGGGR